MVDNDLGKLVSDDAVAHAGSPGNEHVVWFCTPATSHFGEWMEEPPQAVLVHNRPGYASEAQCFRSLRSALDEFSRFVARFSEWHAIGKDPWVENPV